MRPIERRNCCMVIRGQLKIEQINILGDAGRDRRLRYRDETILDVPTKQDLRRGTPAASSDFLEFRVGKAAALPQRAPGLRHNAIALVNDPQRSLLKGRVQFNLIDHRYDACFADNALQILRREIGNTD